MIQSNKYLYQEINKLIIVLKQSGEIDYAKKLEDALSISTIGSEMLGELRLILLELTNVPKQLNSKHIIDESLNYINAIL